MPRDNGQFGLNKKCSPREVRKFVSDALWNDGGIVEYPSGEKVAYEVRYVCEFPVIGEIKKPSLLEEVIKKQAEELISKRRRE